MTVSSLWKALVQGESGTPIGAKDLACKADGTSHTLAVDLSIWICEALSSFGARDSSENSATRLVFTRSIKLLCLGVQLIFVVEGQTRIRDFTNVNEDSFRKRRRGTAFWKACKDCQQMLKLLGVPVVQAKAEGEALCALLSERGIVDGVISSDGDCLLFGAKVVYTKYSNDNLNKGAVIRYESTCLKAVNERTSRSNTEKEKECIIQLSRHDLISFALLTGSDLVGNGLDNIGHKKAIRFIRKCQIDNPLTKSTASFDEIESWAKAATACFYPTASDEQKNGPRCCTRCSHSCGTKRSHFKYGCLQCGTEPREQCYLVTTEDTFRKSLRSKALALRPKFDPSQVFAAYTRPNDNQIPVYLVDASINGVRMGDPDLEGLTKCSLSIGGQDFVRQAVLRLLSRIELHGFRQIDKANIASLSIKRRGREHPVPKKIEKVVTHNRELCFEVLWVVKATITDDNGDGIDGYEYVTIEPQTLIKLKFPTLVTLFEAAVVELKKQGDGMKDQRRNFLKDFLGQIESTETQDSEAENLKKTVMRVKRKRENFFKKQSAATCREGMLLKDSRKAKRRSQSVSDDVGHLLKFAKTIQIPPMANSAEENLRETLEETILNSMPPPHVNNQSIPRNHMRRSPRAPPQTPSNETDLICYMGNYEIQITPVEGNQRSYPPKHIFIHVGLQ